MMRCNKKPRTFKDFISADLSNTFFNPNEFGQIIYIAKRPVTVVFDGELLKEHNASLSEGISAGEFLFFVAVNDCPEDSIYEGAVIMYQNRRYKMVNVREDEGVYYVVLGANV